MDYSLPKATKIKMRCQPLNDDALFSPEMIEEAKEKIKAVKENKLHNRALRGSQDNAFQGLSSFLFFLYSFNVFCSVGIFFKIFVDIHGLSFGML